MVTKFLARLSFKLLMVVSIPLVMFSYWPNHYTPLVKLLTMEYTSMSLAILGFFSERRRTLNPFPAMLMLISILNMFTHGLNTYTQTGVSYVFFFVIAYYALSNFIEELDIESIKSVLVWCAAINSLFAVMQFFHYSPAMDYSIDQSKPHGFMTYPVLASLLAGIGLILSKPSRWYLRVPMVMCLILNPEVSVLFGLMIVGAIKFYPKVKEDKFYIFPIVSMLSGFVGASYIYREKIFSLASSKLSVRPGYWLGAFHHFWSRPLDGWGIGGWSYFVEILFPKTPHNAWNELHNEPLQALFEMGLVIAILMFFWAKRIIKKFSFNDQLSLCLIMFFTASLGHSILHFADGVWLFLMVYVMWEATRGIRTPDPAR